MDEELVNKIIDRMIDFGAENETIAAIMNGMPEEDYPWLMELLMTEEPQNKKLNQAMFAYWIVSEHEDKMEKLSAD